MDNRRIVYALLASVAVFYLYIFIMGKVMPPPPAATQPASQPTGTRPAEAPPAAGSRPSTEPVEAEMTARPGTEAADQGRLKIEGGPDRPGVLLGDATEGNPFPMQLEILPKGATVTHAVIRDHYLTIERKKPYAVFSPVELPDQTGASRTFCSFATPRIRFENLGAEVDLDRVIWSLAESTTDKVTFAVTILQADGSPIARVFKTYLLKPQPAKPRSKERTYDLELTLAVENLTTGDLDAILTQAGPVGFRKEDPRAEDRRVVIARWSKDGFESKGDFRAEILKNPGKIVARDDEVEQQRVAWAAESNRFFACIMAPAGRFNADVPPQFAVVEPVVLDPAVSDHAEDLTFRFITRPLVIPAGQSRQVGFECYIGPKSKFSFEVVPAYRDRNYYEVIREGFYFCAPDALVGLMMWLLDQFHRIPPGNYGVAIIILVLVVRALLHPLTKKSQVNMMKMQQQQAGLKPKIDAIRAKYANDRVKMNQATMELYREEGINPAGTMLSCLPMLLQMPIWIALWTALASTVEMRHAPFDGWWIRDLASQDAVYVFAQPFHIPLISYLMGGPVESINLLPILLCFSQMLQTKFMPKSTTPQPEGAPDQRKMMMFMSVLFVFILWNAPSGLNLYIMSSNFFGIAEQSRIRKHIKELEARKDEEDAKRRAKTGKRKESWLFRKWQELAREAEEAKKVKSSRDKKH
ncbi:MAG TPA: membrane protein insertase YidC [Phycisphaerae bacterium]|nr:membrane protein insertase YidC [Phycisphaerae bacterium]